MAGVQHGQVGVGGVGEDADEAVAVDVGEGLLGAGMQRLAADQQPAVLGPVAQVDVAGELGDRCSLARLAVLPGRGGPAGGVGVGGPDGRVDGVGS